MTKIPKIDALFTIRKVEKHILPLQSYKGVPPTGNVADERRRTENACERVTPYLKVNPTLITTLKAKAKDIPPSATVDIIKNNCFH